MRSQGFTAMELMIVVAILGLLAAAAGPSLVDTLRTQRIRNATFDTIATLTRGRSEAISRNLTVTVTPNSASDWGLGWRMTDSDGQQILKQDALTGVTITGPASIAFSGSGRHTAGPSSLTVTASSARSDAKRCVTVALIGTTSSKVGAC